MPEQAIWTYRNSKIKLLHKSALLASLQDVAEEPEQHKYLIYSILPLCVEEDKEVRMSSWRAVRAALKRFEPSNYHAIDSTMRYLGVQIVSARDIAKFAPPVEVCGLLSMNRNGHVRQAAVEALARFSTGQELPYLFLRATDWVEQVQSLAVAAIEQRLKATAYLPHFITNIVLIPRIWQSNRCNLEQLQTTLEKALATSAQQELLSALTTERESTARYIFDLLARHSGNQTLVIETGLAHSSAIIRLRATGEALKLLPPERLELLIPKCLNDGSPQVRKLALRTIVDLKLDKLNNHVFDSLFDRHGGVRLLARFLLKGLDFSAVYLDALSDSRYSRETILRALAEINTKLNRETIDAFLTDEKPRVRAAAYGLLFASRNEDLSEDALRALSDPSPRCAREVRKYLNCRDLHVPMQRLLDLLSEKTTLRAKRVIIFSISRLGKWYRLQYLLHLYAQLHDNESLRIALEAELHDWLNWFNNSFVTPSREQLEDCRTEMERCRSILPADLLKSIAFYLK